MESRNLIESLRLQSEIKVFGFQVEDFPGGIGAAFDKLVKLVEGEFDRPYYGISEFRNGHCLYRAAAQEMYEGEGRRHTCETYVIEKGEYLAVTIRDWRKKTDRIKDVFAGMMEDTRIDCSRPFVEWYKNDEEMICMVKIGDA